VLNTTLKQTLLLKHVVTLTKCCRTERTCGVATRKWTAWPCSGEVHIYTAGDALAIVFLETGADELINDYATIDCKHVRPQPTFISACSPSQIPMNFYV
jgi:hypothetical protein